MKLYISVDIEGVAGVTSLEQTKITGFEYDRARDWMTGEAVAAVTAALECGVDEIVVSDSHGCGQNMKPDLFPEQVTLVRNWPRPLMMMQGVELGGFAGALLIGYHPGSMNPAGTLSHTISGKNIQEMRLNDLTISEAVFSAATAGHYGVPVIMASGDDVFAEETRGFLGNIEVGVVKTSYGTRSQRSLTPPAAHKEIGAKVKAALGRIDSFQPYKIEAPIRMDFVLKDRLMVELLSYLPCVERLDSFTVRFVAPDMVEASKFLCFVISYNEQDRI